MDKLHFFTIPGVFPDQGYFPGLFKVCANPDTAWTKPVGFFFQPLQTCILSGFF